MRTRSPARAVFALALTSFLVGCTADRSRVDSTAWLQQGECAVITAGGSGRTIALKRGEDGGPADTVVVLTGAKSSVDAHGDWKAEGKATLAPGSSVTNPLSERSDNFRVVVMNHGPKPTTVRILVDNADGCEIIQAPAASTKSGR
ncbi:MAG: hypothetical protein QM783_05465 [Phycisphaerales bacterium]